MATLEQYAEWIVSNPDKEGTEDYELVIAAFKELDAETVLIVNSLS